MSEHVHEKSYPTVRKKLITPSEFKVGMVITMPDFEVVSYHNITIYRIDKDKGLAYGWRPYVHVNEAIEVAYIGIEPMQFPLISRYKYVLISDRKEY